jgi:hypothetical protein
MFEVATETDLSRANRQPGRQHAGEVTKKKGSNQKVEAPPVFRGDLSSELNLREDLGRRDDDDDDRDYFSQDIYRQRNPGGSGQPSLTNRSTRVAHQGQVEEEFVEDPRGSFYNDANRRARMIREIELDRIEQVRRAERLSTIPAMPENLEK